MKLGIEGKRALVTGSDSGIGKAIARTLAAEGAQLVVHGLSREGADRTVAAIIGDGGCAESVVGDLSTPEGAAGVIGAVFVKGGIDILVNNACGPDSALSDWLSIPDEHWEKCFSVNVMSSVRTIRAFVPGMCKKGWGRIINISSASTVTPTAAVADYQASAAALVNLTVSLARSLAGTGVTANVISPGPTLIPEPRDWSTSRVRDPGKNDIREVALECVGDHHGPAGRRWRSTEEISAAAALLVSKSSDFTTGTNLHVGGGGPNILH